MRITHEGRHVYVLLVVYTSMHATNEAAKRQHYRKTKEVAPHSKPCTISTYLCNIHVGIPIIGRIVVCTG